MYIHFHLFDLYLYLFNNFSIRASEKGFNEGVYLGAMTYIFTLAFLIGLPIGFILGGQPVLQYGVIGGILNICTLSTALLLLVPKVLMVTHTAQYDQGRK